MSTALRISGLTKRFGSFTALEGVSLEVPEGSVYGFLGPNGAGKTTTLRIITGLAMPDAGEVLVLGAAPGSSDARSQTGFLPDVPGFYPWMRAEEFLRFTASLFKLERKVIDERVPLLLDLAGLTGIDAHIGGFSRGMKQRLGIAQALVNAPRLLMLDEPTSALDPLGRKEVLDMIASLKGRTTVFFSTHILADVERVCDRVAILDRGTLVEESGMAELKSRYSAHRLEIAVAERGDELAARIAEQAWSSSIERADDGSLLLAVSDVEEAQRAIPRFVSDLGVALRRMDSGEVSLEDVFVELVQGRR